MSMNSSHETFKWLCRAQKKKSQIFETQGTVFIPKGDHVMMSADDL